MRDGAASTKRPIRRVHVIVPILLWLFLVVSTLTWFALSRDLHGAVPRDESSRREWLYTFSMQCYRHAHCTANALPDRLLSVAFTFGSMLTLVLFLAQTQRLRWVHWELGAWQANHHDK